MINRYSRRTKNQTSPNCFISIQRRHHYLYHGSPRSARYRTALFFPVMDLMLVELKDRSSERCIDTLNGINALCPESENFLQTEHIRTFSSLFKADFSSVCNEIHMLKPMVQDRKLRNIVDL
jgi:hypothetical protein